MKQSVVGAANIIGFHMVSVLLNTWFPRICQYLVDLADDEIEHAKFVWRSCQKWENSIERTQGIWNAEQLIAEWELLKLLLDKAGHADREKRGHRYATVLYEHPDDKGEQSKSVILTRYPEWDGPMHAASTLMFLEKVQSVMWYTDHHDDPQTMWRHSRKFVTWRDRFNAAWQMQREVKGFWEE